MRALFVAALVATAFAAPAAAEIDAATRERAIASVGGLRPPPVIGHESREPTFTGTLKRLYEGQALRLGYRDDAFPLSFFGNDGKASGMMRDLCAQVAVALARRVGRNSLEVVAVPVTLNTRDLYLDSGVIDLECGATTNNATRQRRQAFAVTTYVASIGLLVRQGSGVTGLADLNNRALVAVSGTQAERYARTSAALRGLTVRYLEARDAADALQMLESGKADAFVGEEIVLAQNRARLPAARGAKLVLTKDALAYEPQAIMLRKDDPELKKVVDETLVALMRSGEFESFYKRWFETPAGEEQINLQLPMGDPLRNLIKSPSDQGG